jgi:[ribosomal protein S5]-alanine N-acetyltransferase
LTSRFFIRIVAGMHWPERFQTERLVLRRPTAGDARAIFEEYAQDAEVSRYLMWRPHSDLDETIAFLARCQIGWDGGNDLSWAITLAGDDRTVGMIGARPRGHMADIRYVLARRLWGQGIVAEAARAVVKTALRDPSVHRVWAVCDVENRASARVLEKVGMTHEGVLRKWIVHPNISPSPRDVHCYARLRSDGGAA